MSHGVMYGSPAGFLLFLTDSKGNNREKRYALHSLDGKIFQTYLIRNVHANNSGGMTLELTAAQGETVFTIHHDMTDGLWCNQEYFQRFGNLISLEDITVVPLPSIREPKYICQYGRIFCLVSNDLLLPDAESYRFFVGRADALHRKEVVGVKSTRTNTQNYGTVERVTLTIAGNKQFCFASEHYHGEDCRPTWDGLRMHWLARSRYVVFEDDVLASVKRLPASNRH